MGIIDFVKGGVQRMMIARPDSAKELVARHPTELVKRAVWGMLPKGPLGRRIYKKLKVYAGTEHPHAAQQPKPLSLS